MNYTQNHHLPQWVKSDRIRMEDFNDAMANIESGLDQAAQQSEKPYAAGSYTGNGGAQIVDVGFRPSFVIINGMQQSTTQGGAASFSGFSAATAGKNALGSRLMLMCDGFIVYPEPYEGAYGPALNRKGVVYDYLAFR